MSDADIALMVRDSLIVMLKVGGPPLLVALIVGLLIALLQAVTQINEATLTFIPKMIAIIIVLAVMAPWMMEVLQNYSSEIFGNFAAWVR